MFETALAALWQDMRNAGERARASASVCGVPASPLHIDETMRPCLPKAADPARDPSKPPGRNERLQPAPRDSLAVKSRLLAEIEGGLRQSTFELHYQPVVSLTVERAPSLEALMRWRHPDRGLLLPAAFRKGFAEPRIRAAFGMYMLDRVFNDLASFYEQGLALDRVAINVTGSDLRSQAFLDRFFELSSRTGIPPLAFCVEITEGTLIGRSQTPIQRGLRRLHDAGVEIALDDFGTGFASLTHLRQLPIGRLKVDRSFIANMVASKRDQAIVRGIIDIAHNLDAIVVAEGAESIEQVELLAEFGCDMVQGWYFGRACEGHCLTALLNAMPSGRARRTGT
jgi:EAL domain-containing protein (putative c-di-GMP-specific phosphodiesterase class I)